VSKAVSSSYGFEEATHEIQLRLCDQNAKEIEPNTVTLMVTEEISQRTASLHLLDAVTGIELARDEKIEVAISL
jgi:uncharacterized protein YqeY